MRIGYNPEKNKFHKILYKKHRIIIPVYIPDDEDSYFNNLFDVFKESVNSLLNTISLNITSITIINNACKKEVTDYIDLLLEEKKIDKHVKFASNYGKIFTIVSEAKASHENFLTIADADIFYFNDWEKEVFKIFSTFNKVGVVSPVPAPHLGLYNNVSFFGSLLRRPTMKNVVNPKSFVLFEEGINNPKIFQDRNHTWKEKQYYIEKKGVKACVGSGHFIATYKNEFKNFSFAKPEFIFKNGDEDAFLDSQFDKLGYYRVSTLKAFAYHLGNTIPNWVKEYEFNIVKSFSFMQFPLTFFRRPKFVYVFKLFVFKVLNKFKRI